MSTSQPDNMLYSARVNESNNSHAYQGTEDFKWNRESVMRLMSLYHSNKSQFESGFVKKRDLWSQIASEMSAEGFVVNLISCEKKWHNLCATYRRLKDCGMKKRNCWPYFQPLQELLDGNSDAQNLHLNKDCTLGNDSNCNMVKLETSNSEGTHTYSLGAWLPPYQSQIRSSPPDIETGSCDRDLSNMLSVTIEENLDHSQIPRDQPHIPTSFIHTNSDDFKWTHDSVMLLCSLYVIRKEQFLSGAVKKRDLWTEIAQEMNREGFSVTFVACEKKWHNLIATYKKVSMHGRKKTWPYLRFFQKIIEEQMVHAASYGFAESSHLSNNYQKEFSESSQRQFEKEELSDAMIYVEPIKNNCDDFKWTHASVINLCTLYKEKRHEFLSNTVRKRDLWIEVAHEMNSQGYHVTWVHCEKKWYNLYATYKKVSDQNRKRTRIWSTWPYLKLFQNIFSVGRDSESDHQNSTSIQLTQCINNCSNAHDPSSPNSDQSSEIADVTSENINHSTKKQCISYAPEWFLDYCKQQQELEEKRQEEAERRHQELLEVISIGNTALLDLSSSLKAFLNKHV